MIDPSSDGRSASRGWLLRISPVFGAVEDGLLEMLGAERIKRLGRDLLWVRLAEPAALRDSPAAAFLRWNLPLDHNWPCVPARTPGFVEKAARALAEKSVDPLPQTVIAGALDPGERQRYHPKLASNLRGRLLQLLPPAMAAIRDAENQDPQAMTRYLLVGREGLFSGCQSPLASGGFHAGGFKFVRAGGPDRISRAAGKLAAALSWLRLRGPLPPTGARWLEFGASPGGMTAELLQRGYQVTAVDRAPLDPRLHGAPGLRFIEADAADFRPPAAGKFEAILCDINGDPAAAARQVFRHARVLEAGAPLIFTLKLPTSGDLPAMLGALEQLRQTAANSGLALVAATHLGQNRHELTLLLAKQGE